MKVGSLFSGIGGIDLGLERAGFRTAWFCEIDPFCKRVLAKHWPGVPIYDDVRTIGAANLVPVDLLAGGFPCQDVSLAGKRAGLGGEWSTLWGEFARLIRELRPRWVLVENVPGLLSVNGGQFFGTVLRDLAESGYDAEWRVLSASAFGAPHIRERVFFVAHPHSVGWSAIFNHVKCDVATRPSEWQTAQGVAGWEDCQRWFVSFMDAHGVRDAGRVQRNDDGVPARVDRLRALGNAVVPQVVEVLGRMILAAEGA